MSGKLPQNKKNAPCRRCGMCCRTHFAFYVKDGDLARWRKEGRKDILERFEREEAVWAGDRFVYGRNGNDVRSCPFLFREGGRFACAIYSTRPRTCRDYRPGSNELCPLHRPPRGRGPGLREDRRWNEGKRSDKRTSMGAAGRRKATGKTHH